MKYYLMLFLVSLALLFSCSKGIEQRGKVAFAEVTQTQRQLALPSGTECIISINSNSSINLMANPDLPKVRISIGSREYEASFEVGEQFAVGEEESGVWIRIDKIAANETLISILPYSE